MKRLQALLAKNPGYFKKGSEYLAQKVGLKVKTVDRLKKTASYIASKKAYIQSISNKNIDKTASTMVNLISNINKA